MWTLLGLGSGELVKEMNSGDVVTQEKAVEKADCLLASLKEEQTSENRINRTVINTTPSCVGSPGVNNTILMFFFLYLIIHEVSKGQSFSR